MKLIVVDSAYTFLVYFKSIGHLKYELGIFLALEHSECWRLRLYAFDSSNYVEQCPTLAAQFWIRIGY